MINKSNISRVLSVSLAIAGFILILGSASQADAQQNRDPFVKPGYMRQNTAAPGTGAKGTKLGATVSSDAPSIEQRIEY